MKPLLIPAYGKHFSHHSNPIRVYLSLSGELYHSLPWNSYLYRHLKAFVLFWFQFSFTYFWLYWVFLLHTGFSVAGASGAALRGGVQALGHEGFSGVVHRLSCSTACGIFLGQGLNPGPLHWQVDFYPLYHQGRPAGIIRCWTINYPET